MSKPGTGRNTRPTTVSFGAIPVGETPCIAQWAHPQIWTERMLAALHSGVRGGKWHALIDKVYDPRNLFYAARKVVGKKGAPGVDQQTVDSFDEHEREELNRLENLL